MIAVQCTDGLSWVNIQIIIIVEGVISPHKNISIAWCHFLIVFVLTQQSTGKIVTKQFRRQIPDKPDISINLWSIMKNCIGKELSKIPMPVSDRILHKHLLR